MNPNCLVLEIDKRIQILIAEVNFLDKDAPNRADVVTAAHYFEKTGEIQALRWVKDLIAKQI